jgi:hypothetical protein
MLTNLEMHWLLIGVIDRAVCPHHAHFREFRIAIHTKSPGDTTKLISRTMTSPKHVSLQEKSVKFSSDWRPWNHGSLLGRGLSAGTWARRTQRTKALRDDCIIEGNSPKLHPQPQESVLHNMR